jgi:hypothetical protein
VREPLLCAYAPAQFISSFGFSLSGRIYSSKYGKIGPATGQGEIMAS